MRITSFGLFWRESEIDWFPGQGIRNSFRLLGRIGKNRGKLRVADFRHQQGIYILYDEYGPSYVGLTRARGLGLRLKDHQDDNLGGTWDRFSWFGFNQIGKKDENGIYQLLALNRNVSENTHTTIGDLEALLIHAIGPKNNTASMNFNDAEEWFQIDYDEIDNSLAKLDVANN